MSKGNDREKIRKAFNAGWNAYQRMEALSRVPSWDGAADEIWDDEMTSSKSREEEFRKYLNRSHLRIR